MSVGIPSNFDANEADNLEHIEKQFAVVAVEQASTYWTILEKVGGRKFKMTGCDDELYEDLINLFPEFKQNPEAAKSLDENQMKGKEGKAKWFNFAKKYEKKVPDFNFGTLLRLRSDDEYSQENTMFAFRVQFFAIEIFRNRHGFNDWVYEQAHK